MRLVSIQVGKPRVFEGSPPRGGGPAPAGERDERRWVTGYGKQPVHGPVMLRALNLDGDGQADKKWHGGPDMAVLAYAASHYAAWARELGWPSIPHGAFAENFTVEGVDEAGACIGDVWEVGEARLQISEPRKPCRNISRFWDIPELLKLVERTDRYGWYLRVLREGRVEAGQELRLVDRPHPDWSILRAMDARRTKSRDPSAAHALAALPALGADWRAKLLST